MGALLQRDGGITYFVDIIVAGNKLQRRALFEDLHHLTVELAFTAYLLQVELAVCPLLQTGYIIQSTHPDGIPTVTIDHRDASEFRCMDDAPLGTVVIEQTVKVAHEHRTVVAYLNVEVDVVPPILRRRIVPDQRKALRKTIEN